ncbi:MAG: branched-chain amino acid transport system permease protein [Glaciecola sp.]|jgi:branched-chain amino acid transport system permease protein
MSATMTRAADAKDASPSTRRRRPSLYTEYSQDMALLNTSAKRTWTMVLIGLVLIGPLWLSPDLENRVALVAATAIGAIGINLVTGYAGQVSLGHAVFLGVGAYTAAWLGGDPDGSVYGLGLDIWIWLPMAGIVPAILGYLIAPIATRLRGLYLAIVTLGLVFIGEHIFRDWKSLTGGSGTGRSGPRATFFGARWDTDGSLLGMQMSREIKLYYLCVILLIIMAVVGRNIARSKVGRAFAAVRDRDLAAEVMGVPLTKTKVIAFAISSFYAGIAGAMLVLITSFVEPGSFNFLSSLEYLAMIIIGGLATISGSIIGAAFIVLVPRLLESVTPSLPIIGELFSTFEIQAMLNGLLIIAFVILEPRGLFGLWVRVRNYWKAFPFSY